MSKKKFKGFEVCRRWLDDQIAELAKVDTKEKPATPAQRAEFHQRFEDFINNARPKTGKDNVKELVKIAQGLRDALDVRTIDDRLVALRARTDSLTLLTKGIKQQTKVLSDAAASLRLERAVSVVGQLENTMTAINNLKKSLDEDGDVAAALNGLVASIQSTKETLKPVTKA